MKTKELVRQLQEADPSGENEVCVGNSDIHFVDVLPAYYDGRLQVLIRDETKSNYNIVGAKLVSKGEKVVIVTLSIFDALWNDPDMPIDYSECSEQMGNQYKESHDKIRQSVKQCEDNLELQYFVTHIKNRAKEITEETCGVEDRAREFFIENLNRKDPFPNDISREGESYISLRNKQWQNQIDVSYDGSDVVIVMKGDK